MTFSEYQHSSPSKSKRKLSMLIFGYPLHIRIVRELIEAALAMLFTKVTDFVQPVNSHYSNVVDHLSNSLIYAFNIVWDHQSDRCRRR